MVLEDIVHCRERVHQVRCRAAGAHSDCVTWYGATRHSPQDEGGTVPGAANGGRVPGELSLALAQAAVSAVESAGGYAGGVYLRSGNPELLRLAVLAGLPGRLFRPWWRMHVNRPFPVCVSYRSYRSRSRGLALVIGDVQGHGVAAAATMSQLRSVVWAFALSGHDPQEVVSGPAAHRPRPFLTSVRK